MGTLCTLVWICVFVIYLLQKIDTYVSTKGLTVLTATRDPNLDDVEEFISKQGFNLAVGFTTNEDSQTYSLDPSYGELVLSSVEKGYSEDGKPFMKRRAINSHSCTRKELGLNDGQEKQDASFYPLHKSSKTAMEIDWK